MIINNNDIIVNGTTVSSTDLVAVSTVTSDIQTQINTKAASSDVTSALALKANSANPVFTGTFTLPSGTTAQRPGTPTAGMIRFNTDLNGLESHNGQTWGLVSQDLTPFTGINNVSMPHSVSQYFQIAGSTKITSYGAAAMSYDWSNGANYNFGSHGGHDGASNFPMQMAIYLGNTPKAVNQLKWCVHGNSWGYFILEGSTNANTSGSIHTSGNWTPLTFNSIGSTYTSQNLGGSSSGLTDGTILTFNFINNVGYTHYRITIYDSSRPGMAQGSIYSGSAAYGWQLNRI